MLKQIKSLNLKSYKGANLKVHSPIDGSLLATLKCDDKKSVEAKIKNAQAAFEIWRDIPAPKRGELIRIFGEELRKNKPELGKLITIESGKILQEGLGEVQEMIDICDYAVGLSRQIGGYTIPSERPKHTMQENWLPLGVVGVISAFNFPAAVWAWNAALAIVCGDSVVWKPSEKTPLTAIFSQQIFEVACKIFSKQTGVEIPKGLSELIIGNAEIGKQLVDDRRVALVSATGSTAMGKNVGEQVAKRFGKSLLELGGNNAVIVTESADLNVVIPSILFGAVGTCGQRCTTTRRAFVHKNIYENFYTKLKNLYAQLDKKIGNPLDAKTLIGPLIDEDAFANMQAALENISAEAIEICGGERTLKKQGADAFYVKPALVKLKKQSKTIYHETFAPILYIMPYENLADAIAANNAVPQGLSSSIFTTDVREAEIFKQYSDCGIANVNIGTSGAEIGGAFGGEKETGGGRESGSDSWKAYMRRQTSTTYYGINPPALAQGIKFE